MTHQPSPVFADDSAIYDPEEVEFQFYRTRDIPVELLEEVITCYRNREEVCKWCFFLENLQQESGEKEKDPSDTEICAKCSKDWEPVTVRAYKRSSYVGSENESIQGWCENGYEDNVLWVC